MIRRIGVVVGSGLAVILMSGLLAGGCGYVLAVVSGLLFGTPWPALAVSAPLGLVIGTVSSSVWGAWAFRPEGVKS